MAKLDLTEGKILSRLVKLSVPIVATGFMQTAYNLTDMFLLGRLGTKEVAGVGTAGYYIWLSAVFIALIRTGTEIRVAQKTGEKNHPSAKGYARSGIQMSIFFGLLYTVFVYVYRQPLFNIFDIEDVAVVTYGVEYLKIASYSIFFGFLTQVITGAFNGRGNSKIPFIANAIGLGLNIVLDVVLIFGFGPIPKLGVAGAALATSFSQLIVLLVLLYNVKIRKKLFDTFILWKRFDTSKNKDIMALGAPASAYNAFFIVVSMIIGYIIAKYGAEPIAVQKVGSQIESISWMTALGFSVAIGSFTGQNFGAKKYSRVMEGYMESLKISLILGIVNTFILILGAKPLMNAFFATDPIAAKIGVDYLRIIGLSQVFMCLEITTAGYFNGLGLTLKPAVITSICNIIRIPMALILGAVMGLNGIWWTISITSIFKGIAMLATMYFYVKKSDIFFFKDMKRKV